MNEEKSIKNLLLIFEILSVVFFKRKGNNRMLKLLKNTYDKEEKTSFSPIKNY